MNPWIGWSLAVLAFAVGWQFYGWQGLVFAFTVVVFWLLLQWSRMLRVLKAAGRSPVGQIDSAVMLNAKLREGMTLLEVLRLTRSLGRKLADEPETFAWSDAGGAEVRVEFERGHSRRWTLQRPEEAPPAPAPAP